MSQNKPAGDTSPIPPEVIDAAAKAIYEARGLHLATGRDWRSAVMADRHYATRDAEVALLAGMATMSEKDASQSTKATSASLPGDHASMGSVDLANTWRRAIDDASNRDTDWISEEQRQWIYHRFEMLVASKRTSTSGDAK